MLVRIRAASNITKAQRRLKARLGLLLPTRIGPYMIGFQGGNVSVDNLSADNRIWYHAGDDRKAAVPRILNTFGLAEKLRRHASNDICVEINIPIKGATKAVAGFFAKDSETGATYLMHSGKVGGGRKGVGKKAFLNWSKLPVVPVLSSLKSGVTEEAILVGEIDSNTLTDGVARFVHEVNDFKESVQRKQIVGLSNSALAALALKGKKRPQKRVVESISYERNPYVVEYVRRRANGRCDLCSSAAPFNDRQGFPFLESHHIVWLSVGGSDTIDNSVALCPNCHRKMHIVASEIDVSFLSIRAKTVI